jgi:hypothetical protein
MNTLRKFEGRLYFEIPPSISNLYSLKETQRYRSSYKEVQDHLIIHLLIFLKDE